MTLFLISWAALAMSLFSCFMFIGVGSMGEERKRDGKVKVSDQRLGGSTILGGLAALASGLLWHWAGTL